MNDAYHKWPQEDLSLQRWLHLEDCRLGALEGAKDYEYLYFPLGSFTGRAGQRSFSACLSVFQQLEGTVTSFPSFITSPTLKTS
jgi:hypothetical protein